MTVVELAALSPAQVTSLVDHYLEYTNNAPSPSIFRKWTAIHAVGACGERRVWTQFGRLRLYPNLFIFLVGPPGVGKTVGLSPMSELVRKSETVKIAPNDITKQGLLDFLHTATKQAMLPDKEGRLLPFDYSFAALVITELSNFMSKYDMDLAGLLTELFDCPAVNSEKKRSGAGKDIPFPGLSFIIGTATKHLGSVISEEMWGSGFMARVMMIYSAEKIIPKDRFTEDEADQALAAEMVKRVKALGALKGPMIWTLEARAMMNEFCKDQETGAPLHNRLEHYVTRRWLHLAKLCMVAALAEDSMHINSTHFMTAFEWLLEAESTMTEVFKDMASHEDGQIYEDMRHFVFTLHMQTRRPIHHSALVAWLTKRVASHNVLRMIDISENAGFIVRVAGTSGTDAEYVPPKNSFDSSRDLGKL